ncbi:MAG: hydroxymethylbilane synthase [Proteobacteria bacterium]|nr:hydroxymethylbilane synthase [Pseudomonadota bacterium]MDA1355276.1 hydroxymethylbilane synthase [Pseudomonadota bacterium]
MTIGLPLKIGTRGSPLALAQANDVRARLAAAHGELAETGAIETHIIKTSGDKFIDRPLADIGGKGLFTKEIEEALSAGAIDVAVHSMKDVPTWLPNGLEISCILLREDPWDALIGDGLSGLADLPKGGRVGTASLRRRAQLLSLRPDLEITLLRGNVATRVRKVAEGDIDATLLAVAGLKRLDCAEHIAAVLSPEEMLPAVAQGAIGVECRTDDSRVLTFLAALNDSESAQRVAAERALLAALDGSCRTPIAALAEITAGERLYLRALIARPDGKTIHRAEREGLAADGIAMGIDAGAELRAAGGADFFTD